jgi:hypothetical protein
MKVTVNKKVVFIDDGSVNANQNVYKIGNIKLNKNPLPIFYDFDPKFKIGDGFVTRDKDHPENIYVEMALKPKTKKDAEKILDKFSGMFPAIKGVLLPDEANKRKVGGLEILAISICSQPNSDPRIQPILKDDMAIVENVKPDDVKIGINTDGVKIGMNMDGVKPEE